MVAASKLKQADVEKAYDFMLKGNSSRPPARSRESKLTAMAKAWSGLGDAERDRCRAPCLRGVTQLAD